jgi:hypothetical protein
MAGDQETVTAAAAVTAGGELVQISWVTASQDFADPWRVHAL